MSVTHIRITESSVALEFLDHLLVFFVRCYAGYAEGNDLDTADILPLGRKDFVQCIRHFRGMAGQRRITDSHVADLCECRLQSSQKLGLQLAVNAITGVNITDIAHDALIEQKRVGNLIAVFAKALDADIHIKTDIAVYNTERNGIGGTVFVADDFLGVEVINTLIICRVTAERETLADYFEGLDDALAEFACENARFSRSIIGVCTGFCAKVHNFSLLHDDHALSVSNCDHGTVRDNVVISLCVG